MLSDEITVEREYSSLDAIDDHFEKVVISLDKIILPLRNGIKHMDQY
jgi:hypothetical protein